jgi:hypothetical protein
MAIVALQIPSLTLICLQDSSSAAVYQVDWHGKRRQHDGQECRMLWASAVKMALRLPDDLLQALAHCRSCTQPLVRHDKANGRRYAYMPRHSLHIRECADCTDGLRDCYS